MEMGVNGSQSTKLFMLCSSNSKDVALFNKIRTALAGMAGKFTVWSADRLMAGAHVAETMGKELENSDYLVALLSPDYLADEDCQKWEAEATALGKPIIPILLRPCPYKYHPVFKEARILPVHPSDNKTKSVSTWNDEDEAIHTVVEGLETITHVNDKTVKPNSYPYEKIPTKIDKLLIHYYIKMDRDRLKRFDVDSFEESQLIDVEPKDFKELMLTAKEEGYINWSNSTDITTDHKYYSRVYITEKGESRINCFTLHTVVEGIDELVNQQHNNNTNTEETDGNRALYPSKRKPQNNNNMESSFFENGYALLIGVGADLPATVNDAQALYELLINPKIAAFNPGKVQLIVGKNATRQGILDALEILKEQVGSNKEASVIISYAGHGYYYVENGKNIYYLQPADYSSDNPETRLLGEDFTNAVNAVPGKKKLVILDCCHSGGVRDSANSNHTQLKKQLEKGGGSVVLAACRDGEKALDLERMNKGKHGLFTQVLLAALKTAPARTDNNGYIHLTDIMAYFSKHFKIELEKANPGHKQNPIISNLEHYSLSEDFVVCAYDIGIARGGGGGDYTPTPDIPTNNRTAIIQQAIELVTQTNFQRAFELLDELKINIPTYHQLKREFTSGVFRYDAQYAERLITFLRNLM